MNKIYKKIATVAATGAMLSNMALPVFAGEYNFVISGNGSDTENEIELERESETGVFQSNEANVVNDISVSSNTGGNSADDNTGGDVSIDTGNANVSTTIVNQLNSNAAEVEACDCDTDTTVTIDGNGSDSENEVEIENKNSNVVVQENATNIVNAVELEAETGDNEADDNTGGTVEIKTGNVNIKPVEIVNLAGVNQAMIGGGQGDSELDLAIVGNGSDSDNEVDVESKNQTGIFQLNGTSILNELYFGGFTGHNSADDNTGDATTDPAIHTGNVTIEAGILNEAGFNSADADCGCVLDITGKIKGNGTESESEVELELEDELEVAQDNFDAFLNSGEVMSDTGDNDADDNTSGVVEIETGNTHTEIEAANIGGMNSFGGLEIEMPFGSFFLGL